MLRLIGILLILLGLLCIAGYFLYSKKTGLSASKKELRLIKQSGYVSEHRSEQRPSAEFDPAMQIKVPKRKRALSKEAMELLDQVESERELEQIAEFKKKKETGTIPKKGTDVLPQKGKGTDVLPGNGTDVLLESKKGTDILPSERKGTDVLPGSKAGTDVLPKKGNGTDVLPNPGKGTDILPGAFEAQKKGIDILPELKEEKRPSSVEEIEQSASKRAFKAKETAFWEEAKKQGLHGRTDILKEE